jgi:glycolate oxidase iron-sulfur subunit
VDLIVSDAAGCSAHLKEYGHWAGEGGAELALRVRDVTELVAELIDGGVLPRFEQGHSEVAIQDPCHLRHAQRITAAPRTIVSAAGHRPVEIDVDGICCGAAGIYSVLHAKASGKLGELKAGQVRGSGASIVATANPGCEMQLRGHLDPGFEVLHPVELYWRSLQSGSRYAAARR